MRGRLLVRLTVAVVLYLLLVGVFSLLHDYPQFRAQLNTLRQHNVVAKERLWLNVFYFINEAGSGLKFLLTANEKHMRHYPSPSHILAARLARAANGGWEDRMLVARMYYHGEYAPQNKEESLYWLRAAYEAAPLRRKDGVQRHITAVSDELNSPFQ